ncbi:MAG: Holliday junction resolvase RuvX [Hyphomicrobiales bacterium]
MTVLTPESLALRLAGPAPLVGLDLGTKTIGVAVSDVLRTVATARTVIQRTKFTKDATVLLELAAKEGVAAFVIGLPVNMDGSEGPRAQSTRAFVRNLERLTETPIVFWDERLSTAAVERMLIEGDTSRAKRADVVDKLAAAWILQGFLDRLSALKDQS